MWWGENTYKTIYETDIYIIYISRPLTWVNVNRPIAFPATLDGCLQLKDLMYGESPVAAVKLTCICAGVHMIQHTFDARDPHS